MLDGKKGVAQKIVYGAFATVEEKTGRPALEMCIRDSISYVTQFQVVTERKLRSTISQHLIIWMYLQRWLQGRRGREALRREGAQWRGRDPRPQVKA